MQDDNNTLYQMRFPQKLWYLLNQRTDAIIWGGTGRTILLNYRVLHSYLQCDHSIFKTTNISSFVRQLNLYGFRKVTSHLQDPLCNSSNPYMHEYAHDYFQFGHPEMLKKINRKALNMKKTTFRSKVGYGDMNLPIPTTPLQKARQALKLALKKAALELYAQDHPTEWKQCNSNHDGYDCIEDGADFEDEGNVEFDWFSNNNSSITDSINVKYEKQETTALIQEPDGNTLKVEIEVNQIDGNDNEVDISNFDTSHSQNSEVNFSGNILNMPDLESETNVDNGIELLAEFDINNDLDEGIATRIGEIRKDDTQNSLNCVLPSISDHIDDVAMAERNAGYSNYYSGEWDQMFLDIITNKNSSSECATDIKDLY